LDGGCPFFLQFRDVGLFLKRSVAMVDRERDNYIKTHQREPEKARAELNTLANRADLAMLIVAIIVVSSLLLFGLF